MASYTLRSIAAGILFAGFAATSSAQLFDLHNDFAEESNPHNNWSYGSSKVPTGFEAFTDNRQVGRLYSSRGQNGLIGWSHPDGIFPYVGRNDGTAVLYQRWRPGEMLLCPNVGNLAIVRWTNPNITPLRIKLFLTFKRIEDVTAFESQWYVVTNGKVLDSGTMKTGNEERSVTETIKLAPGASVSIAVGCKDHMEGTGLGVSAVIVPKR
jgi:hypothetical protein